MSKQFKPGDLALIVNCATPSNIGKCVELVELVPPGGRYNMGGKAVGNGTRRAVWHVTGEVLMITLSGGIITGHAQKAPRNLMPLRGDFQPKTEKSDEVTA